jgi:hypothetical protein
LARARRSRAACAVHEAAAALCLFMHRRAEGFPLPVRDSDFPAGAATRSCLRSPCLFLQAAASDVLFKLPPRQQRQTSLRACTSRPLHPQQQRPASLHASSVHPSLPISFGRTLFWCTTAPASRSFGPAHLLDEPRHFAPSSGPRPVNCRGSVTRTAGPCGPATSHLAAGNATAVGCPRESQPTSIQSIQMPT